MELQDVEAKRLRISELAECVSRTCDDARVKVAELLQKAARTGDIRGSFQEMVLVMHNMAVMEFGFYTEFSYLIAELRAFFSLVEENLTGTGRNVTAGRREIKAGIQELDSFAATARQSNKALQDASVGFIKDASKDWSQVSYEDLMLMAAEILGE